MKSDLFRVCADIDLTAIRTNIINIKKRLSPGTKTCCVIKADAYGHGAVPFAKAAEDLADFYAVATISEALELKENGVEKPVLILGYIHPDGFPDAIENDIRLTVFDAETARLINSCAKEAGKKARIHIKTDTGMGRIGFAPCKKSLDEITEISKLPFIETEGIFTHLFAADSKDKSSAEKQIRKFTSFADALKDSGVKIKIRHCANSAAAVSMPHSSMNMVRLGIAQYGLYPSAEVNELKLCPALSLKSHVIMVKKLAAGSTIGYGASYTAKKDITVATIPVGYADGYNRRLSNTGYVLINGCFAPVTGRICMDQFMADVSGIADVRRGSEAVLIGSSGDKTISMEEISQLAGSFNYEFACNISKRVPRRYLYDGKCIGINDYFAGKS